MEKYKPCRPCERNCLRAASKSPIRADLSRTDFSRAGKAQHFNKQINSSHSMVVGGGVQTISGGQSIFPFGPMHHQGNQLLSSGVHYQQPTSSVVLQNNRPFLDNMNRSGMLDKQFKQQVLSNQSLGVTEARHIVPVKAVKPQIIRSNSAKTINSILPATMATNSVVHMEPVTFTTIEPQHILIEQSMVEPHVFIEPRVMKEPLKEIQKENLEIKANKHESPDNELVIDELTKQIDLWKGEAQKMRGKLEDIYEAEQKINERDRKIKGLNVQITECEQLIKEYRSKMKDHDQRIKEKDEITQKISFQLNDKERAMNDLRSKNLGLEQIIFELEEEYHALKGRFDEKEQIINRLEEGATTLSRIAQQKEDDIQTLKTRLLKAEGFAQELESELNNKNRQLQDFDARSGKLLRQLESNSKLLSDKDQEIIHLRQELGVLTVKQKMVQENEDQAFNELQSQVRKMNEAEKETSRLRLLLKEKENKIIDFEESSRLSLKELETIRQHCANLEQSNKGSKQEVETRSNAVRGLEAEVRRLLAEAQILQYEIKNRERLLEELGSEVKKKDAKIKLLDEEISKTHEDLQKIIKENGDKGRECSRLKEEFDREKQKIQRDMEEATRRSSNLEERNKQLLLEVETARLKIKDCDERARKFNNEIDADEIERIKQRGSSLETDNRKKETRISELEDLNHKLRLELDDAKLRVEGDLKKKILKYEEISQEHIVCQAKIKLLTEEISRLTYENENLIQKKSK